MQMDGCMFNDRNYYCRILGCINVDRKDSTDIIYKSKKDHEFNR